MWKIKRVKEDKQEKTKTNAPKVLEPILLKKCSVFYTRRNMYFDVNHVSLTVSVPIVMPYCNSLSYLAKAMV